MLVFGVFLVPACRCDRCPAAAETVGEVGIRPAVFIDRRVTLYSISPLTAAPKRRVPPHWGGLLEMHMTLPLRPTSIMMTGEVGDVAQGEYR